MVAGDGGFQKKQIPFQKLSLLSMHLVRALISGPAESDSSGVIKMKIGDIVSLVSGGPKMTVQSVRKAIGKQPVHCIWFEKNKLAQAAFDAGVLKKAVPEGNFKDS